MDQNYKPFHKLKLINKTLLALRKALPDKNIKAHPETLVITNTQRCNLRCAFCSSHGKPELKKIYNNPELDINNDMMKSIAEESLPFVDTVWLSLIGEPLFMQHDNFASYVKYFKMYRNKIIISSNGTLFTKNKIRDLMPNLKEVHLSLDGASKLIFEKIRTGASFYKTMHNVKLLTRTAELIPVEIRPWFEIKLTLCASNLREFPRIVELASHLGIQKIYSNFVGLPHEFSDIGDEAIEKHKKEYNKYLEDAYKKATELKIILIAHPYFSENEIELSNSELPISKCEKLIIKNVPDEYFKNLPALKDDLNFTNIEEEARTLANEIISVRNTERSYEKEDIIEKSKKLEGKYLDYLQCILHENEYELNEILSHPERKFYDCWFLDNYLDVRGNGNYRYCCNGPTVRDMLNINYLTKNSHQVFISESNSLYDVYNSSYTREFHIKMRVGDFEGTCINCIGIQERTYEYFKELITAPGIIEYN